MRRRRRSRRAPTLDGVNRAMLREGGPDAGQVPERAYVAIPVHESGGPLPVRSTAISVPSADETVSIVLSKVVLSGPGWISMSRASVFGMSERERRNRKKNVLKAARRLSATRPNR